MKKALGTLLASALALAVFSSKDGRAATPASGSISSTSGTVSWSYAPVVAGSVVDTGTEDLCPPGICDNFDLTVVLPAPAATFYQTYTATLSFHYTWSS